MNNDCSIAIIIMQATFKQNFVRLLMKIDGEIQMGSQKPFNETAKITRIAKKCKFH